MEIDAINNANDNYINEINDLQEQLQQVKAENEELKDEILHLRQEGNKSCAYCLDLIELKAENEKLKAENEELREFNKTGMLLARIDEDREIIINLDNELRRKNTLLDEIEDCIKCCATTLYGCGNCKKGDECNGALSDLILQKIKEVKQ